jgi:2-hydroxychromene-2-carboxylate isomerase
LQLELTHFTDPACPFAFSAEPVRMRLRWHYGDQLVWRTRMIVLTLEPGEAERLAEGAPNLQRTHGMPIDPVPYARTASSEPACRAVVAARLQAPGTEERLLRRLRVRVMQRGLLDDPELIAAAARDAGLDPAALEDWCKREDVEAALRDDIEAARTPQPAARALDHKLGGLRERRRYTAPSYELTRSDGAQAVVPGFNPIEAYEVAIANLAPDLVRRQKPERVADLLAWAGEPLATAEVALVMQLDLQKTRAALSRVATPLAAGADFYWTLTP